VSIDHSIRHQLVVLVRRGARTSEFTTVRPTDWRPEQVPNPEGLLLPYFDDRSAWELVAARLESGHEVETVTLEDPPGKTGYVMKIELNPRRPLLYVKLELGRGEVIGRSFHESERKRG
jgi:hypothetical protein